MPGPSVDVRITGDSSDLEKAFRASGDAVNSFGGTFKRTLGTTISTAGINAASTAINSLFDFGQTGLDQFDQLGDALAIVDSNVAGLSGSIDDLDLTRLGFDKIETAQAAVDITALGDSIEGLTDADLGKMAPDLIKAAAGFSSLTGTDAAGSADLIAKALGGSAKAAKTLGIELKKGATPAENYAAIMDKWGPLAEDAAEGTGSLADQQAVLDAKMSNLSTGFGEFLDSALTPILAGINDLIPAFEAFAAGGINAVKDAFKFLQENGAVVAGILGALGALVLTVVVPPFVAWAAATLAALAPFIALGVAVAAGILILEKLGLLTPIVNAVTTAIDLLGKGLGVVFDFIANTVVPVVVDLTGKLAEALQPAVQTLGDIFTNVLLPAFQTTFAFVTDTVLPLLGDLLGLLGDVAAIVAGAVVSAFNTLTGILGTVAEVLGTVLRTIGDVLGAIGNAPFISDVLGFFGGGNSAASVAPAASAASNLLAGPSGAQAVAARVGTASAVGDTYVTIQTTGDSLAIERAVNRALARNARLNGGVVVPVRV